MRKYDELLQAAIDRFWNSRDKQAENQGHQTGVKDAGLRSAVTAGKHMDGFVDLVRSILSDAGLKDADIHWSSKKELPGYFRAEKSWDLLAVVDGHLLAAMEFKSHVGPSFGNNFNNRTEEVLGSATDFWAAYREGAFKPSQRPWLGYVLLLEDCAKSQAPVKVARPHFDVFPEFVGASYAKRYELSLLRLVRERLYDSASLILANKNQAATGAFTCPSEELSFTTFAALLSAHALAFVKVRQGYDPGPR